MADAVRVEGLADVRTSLRKLERTGERKEVTRALKQGASVVAVRGATLAPKGTRPIPASRRPRKRLADTIAPGATGNTAFVRSRAVYGPKIERRTAFLSRALRDEEEKVAEVVGDALDAVFRAAGWR